MREKKAAESSPSKNDFGEFPLSAEDVEEVAQVVEQRQPQPAPHPQTPRKAMKTDPFMTPGSKRKREEDSLPTPVTGGMRGQDVFTSSSSGRVKAEEAWDGSSSFGLRSPFATPTPSRFRDIAESEDPASEKDKPGYDITDEVMDVLKGQHIDEDTSASLRHLLAIHAMKVSGIAKGRDITRVALKSKDAKIAELQQKITALETEREMDKTIIRHFKSDMAESISRRGRGRGRS
jgi:hypothetical protein